MSPALPPILQSNRTPLRVSDTRMLIGILLIAVLVRLFFSLYVSRELLGKDPQIESNDGYHLIAENLYHGNGYRFAADEPVTLQRAPAYPLFLTSLFTLTGIDYVWVQVAQALLGGVACLFLFLLGRWTHSTAVGLVAAAMFAFYPNAIIYSARLYAENLYFPLFLGFAYFLCRASLEGSMRRGAIAGALWGAGLMTRGTLLPLPLVMPFGIAVSPPHRSPASRWLRWCIPAAITGLVMIAPWAARNYELTGKVVAVSSWSWGPLYSGAKISAEMIGWQDLSNADRSAIDEIHSTANIRRSARPAEPATPRDELVDDQVAKELTTAFWAEEGIARIALQAAAGVVFAWFLTFDTGTRLFSLVMHVPLLLLCVAGAVHMARFEKPAFARAWPALALVIFVNASHALAYPHVRYMTPAITLSFLFSAVALVTFANYVMRRWSAGQALAA